ncbi:hypothetical protein GCM10009641_25080 [Mycobacterium cookii]|uniref:Uncharacterized protein n=1 Tax=Mycobacterium cookii TaxID=1775 RepID=A0A7I7KS07_9MYCO|nr:hypothetical protein MCOO_09150 [Mycobacterium cookii]
MTDAVGEWLGVCGDGALWAQPPTLVTIVSDINPTAARLHADPGRDVTVSRVVQTVTTPCRIRSFISSYCPVTWQKVKAIHALKSQGPALRYVTIEASDDRCSRRKPRCEQTAGTWIQR